MGNGLRETGCFCKEEWEITLGKQGVVVKRNGK